MQSKVSHTPHRRAAASPRSATVQNLGKSARRQNLATEELAYRLGEKRLQLGLGMEARAIHKASGSAEDVLVYFGIIDYLQVCLSHVILP